MTQTTYEYCVKEKKNKMCFKSMIEALYYIYEVLKGLNCEDLIFDGELVYTKTPFTNKLVKKRYVITTEFPKTQIILIKRSTGELSHSLILECLNQFKKIIKERN